MAVFRTQSGRWMRLRRKLDQETQETPSDELEIFPSGDEPLVAHWVTLTIRRIHSDPHAGTSTASSSETVIGIPQFTFNKQAISRPAHVRSYRKGCVVRRKSLLTSFEIEHLLQSYHPVRANCWPYWQAAFEHFEWENHFMYWRMLN